MLVDEFQQHAIFWSKLTGYNEVDNNDPAEWLHLRPIEYYAILLPWIVICSVYTLYKVFKFK